VSTALIKGKIKLVGIPNNNDYRKDLLRQQQSTNCNHSGVLWHLECFRQQL